MFCFEGFFKLALLTIYSIAFLVCLGVIFRTKSRRWITNQRLFLITLSGTYAFRVVEFGVASQILMSGDDLDKDAAFDAPVVAYISCDMWGYTLSLWFFSFFHWKCWELSCHQTRLVPIFARVDFSRFEIGDGKQRQCGSFAPFSHYSDDLRDSEFGGFHIFGSDLFQERISPICSFGYSTYLESHLLGVWWSWQFRTSWYQ